MSRSNKVIVYLDDEELTMLELLRNVMANSVPGITLKTKLSTVIRQLLRDVVLEDEETPTNKKLHVEPTQVSPEKGSPGKVIKDFVLYGGDQKINGALKDPASCVMCHYGCCVPREEDGVVVHDGSKIRKLIGVLDAMKHSHNIVRSMGDN